MIRAWRIVKKARASTAFDGEGARIHGGRWNSPGRSAVYAAESRALATLEILAGLGAPSVLAAYTLIRVSFPPRVMMEVDVAALPSGWDAYPPGPASQGVGDRWLASEGSAVLRVPSVIVPGETNYVLNPRHPAFGEIRRSDPEVYRFDPRLLG